MMTYRILLSIWCELLQWILCHISSIYFIGHHGFFQKYPEFLNEGNGAQHSTNDALTNIEELNDTWKDEYDDS